MLNEFTDPDHEHYFKERMPQTRMKSQTLLCLCDHFEDEHDEFGHESQECGWKYCGCKEFRMKPDQ